MGPIISFNLKIEKRQPGASNGKLFPSLYIFQVTVKGVVSDLFEEFKGAVRDD